MPTVRSLVSNSLVRTDEELQLHLLEFTAAERVVARRHLVAEALAHLRDAERHGLAARWSR